MSSMFVNSSRQGFPTFVRMPSGWQPTHNLNKRGLVISSNKVSSQTRPGMESVGWGDDGGIDAQGLRFALLFWDQLAYPGVPFPMGLGPPNGPDEAFLMQEEILIRPIYSGNGSTSDLIHDGHSSVFSHLEKEEPGVWAIGDGNLTFFSNRGLTERQTGYSFELHRAIPVPDKDVPLPEILAFKAKRVSELIALRTEIDSFSKAIISEDSGASLNAYVNRIDKSCADALRVGHEWQFPVRLGSITPSFEFSPYQAYVAANKVFHESSAHLPMTEALGLAGIAALGSQIKFKPKDFGWKGFKRVTPFRYVTKMHKELF